MRGLEGNGSGSAGAGASVAGAGTLASGHYLLIGALIVGGLGLAALSAAGAAEPVVLALLAILAVIGLFSLFGALAGFVRLNERAIEAEIATSAADGLDIGVQIAADDGAVVYCNRAFERLLGAHGVTGSLADAFAGEPAAAEALFRLSRAAERGEMRQEEFSIRSAVGEMSWLRVAVRPYAARTLISDDRRFTVWSLTDISGERTRETERVGSLEALIRTYDTMPAGFVLANAHGRIVHVNDTLIARLGLRRPTDGGAALTLTDLMTFDGAAALAAVGGDPSGRTAELEVELLCEDGRTVPASIECKRAGDGGLISAVVLDRTAPVPSDQPWRASRLLQAAPFGIATVDRDGALIEANTAFLRMFAEVGAEPARPGMPAVALVEEVTERQAFTRALERAIAGRPSGAPVEIVFGANREAARRIYMQPLGGRVAASREAAILYAIDASEQKALELKFAQSQKMEAVGQLAGGIAHDFNNVLTVIIGLSDLLLQGRRTADPGHNDLMQIKSNANRAAGMVRQLLAFSRKQTLEAEVLALNEVVQDFSYSLVKALTEKVELKMQAGRDLWYVKADRTQLEQVILNLAVNARDAMPAGGRLTLRTRNVSERESVKLGGLGVTPGEYVLIEAEDSGSGMPPEVQARIFEPFYTTKDVGKGTGLGLSTVYGIVKQTGGYIFVDSAVGRGTTFRVYLPRHAESEEAARAQEQGRKKDAPRDLTGSGRVLLVEDEDAVRSFAVRALKRQGYEVHEAASGLEALDVMEREGGRIDIVVSDVVMPEMDGPTMLKEMRRTMPDLKIVFVSGYPADAFNKGLDEDEEFAFLPKPFTLAQLAAKVKEELGR